MNKEINIGIIGLGYVGSAIKNFFANKECNIYTFDTNSDKASSAHSVKNLLANNLDFVFLCLPTPMKKDGSCSIKIVDETLEDINNLNYRGVVILKSTMPPKTTENFQKSYNELRIIFNPEFLTEANFLDDFKNQDYIVLGGNKKDCILVEDMYNKFFTSSKIVISSSKEAEMLKYYLNCFLAVKVSFANEIYQLCSKLNISYENLIKMVKLDSRIGKTHLDVPGPDGSFGFGGSCFAKDISALLSLFEENDIISMVIKSSWERNLTIDRVEKDWEKLKGRSVL